MRTVAFLAAGLVLLSAAGCNNAGKKSDPMEQKVEKLTAENEQLTEELSEARTRNEKLERQLQTLSGLPEKLEPSELYPLDTVKLTSYTGFYDKDDDGRKEVLIVYVQPLDNQGDAVKAAGSVEVSLWDLDTEAAQAKLGSWRVDPEQLRQKWFSTFMRTNYRLIFPVGDIVKDFDRPLTVKMKFTDHITGKVSQDQHVVEPDDE